MSPSPSPRTALTKCQLNVQQSEIFKDFRRKALFKPFESVLCLLFYVSFKMPSHPKYHLVFLVDEYPELEDAVKLPRSTFMARLTLRNYYKISTQRLAQTLPRLVSSRVLYVYLEMLSEILAFLQTNLPNLSMLINNMLTVLSDSLARIQQQQQQLALFA